MTEDNLIQDKWKTRAYMGVAVVMLCLLAGLALYIFGILWQAVATIIATAIISFMLHGAVNYLVAHGASRLVATIVAMAVLLAVIVGIIALFVPPVVEQIASLSQAAPTYLASARTWINSVMQSLPVDNAAFSGLLDQATTWAQEQSGAIIQSAAGGILVGVTGVGNGLLVLFIALLCSFWVLVDLPTISREVMSLFTPEQQKNVRVVTGAFNTAVYGWMKATLACAIVDGLFNGFAYWIMGLPYFALLGVMCGLFYIIPYIGPGIGAVIVVLAGLLVSPTAAIVALIINTVVNNVVGSVLSPRLMSSSVSVHPAISLVAILAGGALGGVLGMLFSIPIVAAAQGVFITFFEERTGKQLATEDGALFHKPKVKYKPTWRKPNRKKKDDQDANETQQA